MPFGAAMAVAVDGVVRHKGDEFVGDVAGRHAGDLGVVVCRSDFDDVRADEVHAAEAADDFQQLAAGDAAGFRGAGTRGVGRIQDVDVDGNVQGTVADAVADLGDGVDALVVDVGRGDDAEAEAAVVVEVLLAVERAAGADVAEASVSRMPSSTARRNGVPWVYSAPK